MVLVLGRSDTQARNVGIAAVQSRTQARAR
jgi:hypothetical protein